MVGEGASRNKYFCMYHRGIILETDTISHLIYIFQETTKNQKSCGGFLEDFSPKQKAMFVFLSLILIGTVSVGCIIATREPKKGMPLRYAKFDLCWRL